MAPRNFYRGSPNYAVVNLLIVLAVLRCLWNVWVTPAKQEIESIPLTTTDSAATDFYNYQDVSSRQQEEQAQYYYATIYDNSSRKHVLPVQLIDGRPMVAIPAQMFVDQSSPQQLLDSPSKLLSTPTENSLQQAGSVSNPVSTSDNSSAIVQPRHVLPAETGSLHTKRVLSPNSNQYKRTPVLHATSKSPPRSKFSKHHNSSTAQRSLPFLLALSASVITGALFAKRALEKLQKWEEQSTEDSLAYDMAYTDTVSEIGYGSFVSTWDDLDKFDV